MLIYRRLVPTIQLRNFETHSRDSEKRLDWNVVKEQETTELVTDEMREGGVKNDLGHGLGQLVGVGAFL